MMEHLSLDELFREARAAAKVERTEAFKKQEAAARRRMDPVSAVPEPLGIFADPDNWLSPPERAPEGPIREGIRSGLTFVGPPAEVLDWTGNKAF